MAKAHEDESAIASGVSRREFVGGAATAYVCRQFVCATPVTDPAALAELVGTRSE